MADTSLSELDELRRARLQDNQTYRQLSRLVGVSFTRLHTLLTRPTNDDARRSAPNDRSLFKIREYLAARRQRKEQEARATRRRGASTTRTRSSSGADRGASQRV